MLWFQEKDSYGNEVQKLARPLPVEYLLVDVPVSTPKTPVCTFYYNENITPFPVENRWSIYSNHRDWKYDIFFIYGNSVSIRTIFYNTNQKKYFFFLIIIAEFNNKPTYKLKLFYIWKPW